MRDLNKKRQAHGICAMGNFIYVAGGIIDLNYTSSVERYDINTDTWEYFCPLPYPCFSMTMVAIKKRYIICFGDSSKFF